MTDISITCPVNSQENCLLVKFTGFFYAFPGFIFIFFLLLLNFFSFFKKSCPTISKPEKDILEIRLTECLFFAIIGWGHKKMKLFCTQYARPSRHCFKKNVYLLANDDKTMLRIFSVFLQKTSWNTSGGFL